MTELNRRTIPEAIMPKIRLWLPVLLLIVLVIITLVASGEPAQAVDPVYLPLIGDPELTAGMTPTVTHTNTPMPTATPTGTPTATPTATATATATSEATPIAADLHVDDDNTSGTETGATQFPYNTVQEAIAAANDGATIAVAGGTYSETIRIQDKRIHLFGGFTGASATDYAAGNGGNFNDRNLAANSSHLQGDRTDSVVTLIEAAASTVDGFRISGGTRSLVPEFGELGGGIYVSGGAPTIANNLIENNDARPAASGLSESVGGGIFAGDANITIVNNVIRNNIAGRGAGIAISGGAVVIRGNTVQGNIGVSDHGGGLYIFAPQAEITRNRIIGNEIGRELGYGWGGGIVVFGDPNFPGLSSAVLSFNTVTENYAPSVGSGVFIDDGARATLDHELIYNNVCPDGGTTGGVGVYVDGYDQIGSQATIMHTTVAGHNCTTQGGNGLYVEVNSGVTIQNSIFWGNGGDDFFVDPTSQITATYTTAEETIPGVGNLSSDPLFANPSQHDYHLQSTAGRWDADANGGAGDWVLDANHSPAIDAADPTSPFANEPNPNGGRANMGVYGNTVEASKSSP
jgi:hypothetical protein